MPETPAKDRRFASTLARGLSVLRAFRASDDGLGNAEIAARTGLPKSSVSRLTFTLESLGYLVHNRRHGSYRLGPAVLALGNIATASLPFLQIANPLMQRLADDTGTLVLLGVRDCDKFLLVKTWRPRDTASIWLDVGYRLPMEGSSSGQALMAAMTEDQFTAMRAECSKQPEEITRLRKDAYGQLMARGFVIAPPQSRFASTINAVSVPYRSHEFSEPVAFSCGALPEILTDKRMQDEVGPKLLSTVQDLEHATGQTATMRQQR